MNVWMRTMTLHGPRGRSGEAEAQRGTQLAQQHSWMGSQGEAPHQMEFSPQIPPVRGQSGPRSRAQGQRGDGHLTCQILGRTQLLPPGSRPGRWTAPWASGPECHTPGPTGGRGGAGDLELRRLGGGSGRARWKSPGSWGWVSGLVTLGSSPLPKPLLGSLLSQVRVRLLLGSSASSPGLYSIHPRWRLSPGFQRPLPSAP